MEEEGKMTIKDLLRMTAGDLEDIAVPIRYADLISRPIYQAVCNIRRCIDAMEEAAEKQEEKQDGDSKGI